MKISEIISELDKQRRIENITQEEMAERFGVSRATYNNYLMGKTKPNDQMMRKMFAYINDLDAAENSLFSKDVLPNPSNIPPFNESNAIVKIELGESEEPHFFTLAQAAEFILNLDSELGMGIGLAAEDGESIRQQLQEMSQIKEKLREKNDT